ncbi:MAG: hypothetical protein AAF849_09895 [Bacteroidota bacterium]
MNTAPTKVIELNEDFFNFEEFEDEMDVLQDILPAPLYDEDYRNDLPNIIQQEPEETAQIASNFDLMLQIFEKANSVEEIRAEVTQLNLKVRAAYEANMKKVFEQTKPFEKTARALQLLYENAGYGATVYLLPVRTDKFADAANPKHFDIMEHYLLQQFFKFRMEDSPFYISYIGNYEDKKNVRDIPTIVKKVAKVATETRALAVLDIPEKSSAKAAINYAKRNTLKGIHATLGHVMMPCTWGYKVGARDIKIMQNAEGKYVRKEEKMSVPLSAAIVGRMLGVDPGEFISGLEAEAIVGINGVKMQYDLERKDAEALDEVGLNMILDSGHFQGSTTLCKGNPPELRKFVKMDVANALLKDLVQFCNNKAFSKWGREQQKAFKRELEIYLNRRFKQDMIGQGSTIDSIEYDTESEVVEVKISINFFEVADKFQIDLRGKKGGIDTDKYKDK